MSGISQSPKGTIARHEILYDPVQQQRWTIGSYVGIGDVGEMYEAALYDGVTNKAQRAVIQIEPFGDGTPSAQMQFYIDNVSPADIHMWKKARKMTHLGVQTLLGSGTHQCSGQKYRFIVLEGCGTDLWSLFVKNGRQFPEHTVYKVALQILPALEYIHSRQHIDGNVKGANLILDESTENYVYLINLIGLVSQHKNPKQTLGSMEYMSRDAHTGVSTMRGDIESIFYNMIQWLCGTLPWEKNLLDAPWVQQQKKDAFTNTEKFLRECFKASEIPVAITEFMKLLSLMKYDDKPKYTDFSKILVEGLNKLNHVPSGKLELSVKSDRKSMPVITSIKTVKPKDANTSQQSASVGDSSQDNAASKGADLSTNIVINASAAPNNKHTNSTAEIAKNSNDCSTQFETQMTTKGHDSRANSESQAADESSRRIVCEDNNHTHEGSKAAEKVVRFSGAMEKSDAKSASPRTDKGSSPALSDISNSQPPEIDKSSCERLLTKSDARAVKRKTKDSNEVPLKRSERNTAKANQKLDDSGIAIDNATSESNSTSSSDLNSELPAACNTPLHDAVNAKNLAEVNELLVKGASICACNPDGNTPLHLAFMLKNKGIVDVLLSAIKSTSTYENVKNKVGLTTLHIASARNNREVIKYLLKSTTDLKDSVTDESSPWNGFTALHFAAKYKSAEATKILAEASSKSDLLKENGNGETAFQIIKKQLEDLLIMSDILSLDNKYEVYDNFSNFHVACARDDPETVKSFLEKGALIDAPVFKSANICPWFGPIHFAVERRSAENVKILLENGADLTRTNHKRMTPLHMGLYTEKNGERTELVDSLYEATRNKETNPKDKYNLSYLHVACTRNDANLVKKLLDKNVDVNSKVTYVRQRFYNYTPLHFATQYENPEIVRLLIARGADVNACDGAHTGTPLHIAFDYGHEEIVKILLSSGANPTAISPVDKQSMLHCLVGGYVKVHENNDEAMLSYVEKLIIEFGVDVNVKDHDGDTALHIACEQFRASAPVAKLLLDFGADINAENHEGKTPFEWALHGRFNHWDRNVPDQLSMLYHHVKKLEAIGFEVNEKNKKCCKQLLKKRRSWRIENLDNDHLVAMEQERQKEIEEMKKVKLAREMSLYDFVKMEPERFNEAAGLDSNEIAAFVSLFPSYGYLIKLQLSKLYPQVKTENIED